MKCNSWHCEYTNGNDKLKFLINEIENQNPIIKDVLCKIHKRVIHNFHI